VAMPYSKSKIQHMNLFKSALLSFFFLLLSSTFVIAQNAGNLLAGKDLSTIKVDALTNSEIAQIQAQLKQSGVSIDMVESQAIAKGMSPSEFAKLKARLSASKTGSKSGSPLVRRTQSTRLAYEKDTTRMRPINKFNPLIYGSELFANEYGFGENQNIATPLNYEVGTNDILKLVVYGVQEYSSDLEVSKEGSVLIENVGRVKVAGLTIEAATTRIRQQMGNTAYPSLRTGESKLALTVGDTRTIQVTIIGAERSGNYNVSSLSTILNALTEAGGPSEIGSYRNIELIRNNKLYKKIDLYAFMQNGDQSQNMGLKDRDVIRVPAYKGRVEIKGQVKRPGIFEINSSTENFNQFLQYAGGFDDTAYTAWVKVIQKNDKEKVVKDLSAKEFASYIPQGGDIIQISKILDRFQNRVKLSGAVFRPDYYELTDGMRISDLIQKADGLKEDAYLGRAQLIRLKPNLLKELVSINLSKALQKGSEENIYLQREDEIYINSIIDLRDSLTVDLLGEVRNEGRFNYIDSMTVKDLILMAGGFKYEASKQIELARLIQNDGAVSTNNVATIFKTIVNGDLSFNPGQENFVLQPLDVVTITKKVGYTNPEVVSIKGQVQSEGKYTLSSRVERVSDIVKRAGGLIGQAYSEGAFIKRSRYNIDTLRSDESKTSIEQAYIRKFKNQQLAAKMELKTTLMEDDGLAGAEKQSKKTLKDSLELLFKELENDYYQIAIDINQIMDKPGSELDLVLRDKDEIVIPKTDNRVKISGGVLRPTNIVYRDGLSIGECISAAGGISEYARRGRAYVVYANGKSKRTMHFGIFRINPTIKPGSEVVLPETDVKKEKPFTSILQLTTVLAQIGSVLATIAILNR
jgi:protein involved in polysaccharide export with SLBB domain